MKRFLYSVMACGCLAVTGSAQIQITDLSKETAVDMADTLIGQGVVVTNVVYTGATNASGSFCSGQDAVGFNNGIVLTSGNATSVIGPNNSSAASQVNNQPGDSSLDGLIGTNDTHDAAVLEFDFIPQGASVQFNYVFGSEEYNEFVGSPFNDVFGFFVNGINYALIPGTATPVSINNVNNGYHDTSGVSTGPCNNCQYFIDNTGTNAVRNTQLDGLTTVLTFTAPVNPGVPNHLKIAIADAGDFALDSAVFIQAGSFSSTSQSSNCVTRNAQFWYTHPRATTAECAALKSGLAAEMRANCNIVDLGFMTLPSGYRNNDNVRDAEDAVIEALGLYWRSRQRTGEIGGTQNQKLAASKLCRERKRLAIELLAALANVNVLGTDPSQCSYFNGVANVNFPATLISDARTAAAGDRVDVIQTTTALLHKFNSNGVTNDFPTGIVECSPEPKKSLRAESRDPTLQATCPGLNKVCSSAEALYFKQSSGGLFSHAKLSRSANLTSYTNSIPSPSCGVGGANAIWKINPDVGQPSRHFTADTFGSNIDTLLSVFEGTCDALSEVACSDDDPTHAPQSKLTFSTDGTNTFYIVAEGKNGAVGNVKLHLTSP